MAKKRANGEGCIRQRENKKWEAQVMVGYRADGSRAVYSFTGATRKEAKDKMNAFLKKREEGARYGQDTRFDEWADTWFDGHKDNISATTQEGYRYTLRILKDHFGRKRLAGIKAIDVEQFLRKRRAEGKSDSSLAQCRGMLFQIMKKAVANDLINKNPVECAEKMRKRPPQRKESFTADEVRLLMEKLPENKIGWSIRLMLATGMRTQELLGLEPRHIAKDGSTVTIEQAVVRIKGSIAIGPPKSYDSYRTIPVPEMVQYCARLLRETDKKFIWEVGRMDMPCNPSHFAKQFKLAVEKVDGVRVLTPHCTRHSYVSMMQMLGVDIETIQNMTGHAEVDMTRHYLHVQEPRRLDAAQRFSDAFSRQGQGVCGNILDYRKSS